MHILHDAKDSVRPVTCPDPYACFPITLGTYNLTKGMQRGVLRGHGVGRTRDFHYVFSGKAVRTGVQNLRANDIMPAEDPEDSQEVEEATYLLEVFTDSDWASCHGTRRSTSCAVLAWNGSVVFSYSRRQKAVSLSSGEAEYHAAASGASEGVYLKNIVQIQENLFD